MNLRLFVLVGFRRLRFGDLDVNTCLARGKEYLLFLALISRLKRRKKEAEVEEGSVKKSEASKRKKTER
ncbi:hypothetical protein E2C01_025763 [Portunus trituberculatus]|uniref:Uncharacterized protein n=1 Tax=Portunus trituberculatus TaxID=210409 RepID=A0A5B7EE82_PORTR|nr:hypothetical protein [Portunus trituberculatus]